MVGWRGIRGRVTLSPGFAQGDSCLGYRLRERFVARRRLPELFRAVRLDARFREEEADDRFRPRELEARFRAVEVDDRLRDDPAARRLRVAAALRADADRADFERDAEARPPIRPPFRDELVLIFFPRPEPLFFPPPVSLFTVAQARRSASSRPTPRSSYPSSMCSAMRFCLDV